MHDAANFIKPCLIASYTSCSSYKNSEIDKQIEILELKNKIKIDEINKNSDTNNIFNLKQIRVELDWSETFYTA